MDVTAEDHESRNVLHWAAHMNDAALIHVVLADRENNSERKEKLDINGICHKQGWTPLHYAAEKGNLAACKALIQGGASLSVNAAIINSKDGSIKAKGPTPLELVKQRMKKPGSPQHLSSLEGVLNELTNEEAKVKQQKDQPKQRKDQENANESGKQPQKEPVPQEKSLKEKSEAGKESDKTEKKKRKKKKGAAESSNQERQLDPLSSLVAATDLISRDEMLENLINMGFPEADCMAAIVACGTNIDRAISWLCERPNLSAPNSSHASAQAKVASTQVQTSKTANSVAAVPKEKEKDHKEELRRINKAWNQKAEDELKRQEQERKAKEIAKQQISMSQKANIISLKDLEKQQTFHSPARNGHGSKLNGNNRFVASPSDKPPVSHQV